MIEDLFTFWFDGVLSCSVALLGLLMNSTAICILYQKENTNLFNQLLVFLFCLDNCVLFTSILWDIEWNVGLGVDFLVLIYPYFTYPLNCISMTASILMTIAMAHERFLATKNPIRHNQKMKDPSKRPTTR